MKQPKPANTLADFEPRLTEAQAQVYELRLYVAGAASRSTLAVRNITGLCEAEIPGRYRLEIINVYQQPSRAAEDQISAVPTLVKISPLPRRKLIGDLSHDAQVGRSLGFRDLPGSEPASNS